MPNKAKTPVQDQPTEAAAEATLTDVLGAVGKLADTVAELASQVKVIDATQQTLGSEVREQATRPAPDPQSMASSLKALTVSPGAEAVMKRLDIWDNMMEGREHKFLEGDVVRLIGPKVKTIKAFFSNRVQQAINTGNEGSQEEAKLMVKAITDEEAPLGKVWGFTRVSRRHKQPRYRVVFPLIGTEGCLESEIVLVKEAGK